MRSSVMHKVYIGYDGRESAAYEVAESSLRKRASEHVAVTPLCADQLAACGLLRRPQDRRGLIYDIPSNAPCATDFAISRFLVPHLAQIGWALFVDCDVVFLADVAELFAMADPSKAVMVVKHGTIQDGYAVRFDERCELVSETDRKTEFYVHPVQKTHLLPHSDWDYLESCLLSAGGHSLSRLGWSIDCSNWRSLVVRSKEGSDLFLVSPVARDCVDEISAQKYISKLIRAMSKEKMDGQAQLAYSRKNWSSVMLFNCDHPANRRLSLQDVNERPGRDLHGFYWLHDSEIGELPGEWNWLVNVQPKPERPKIAHFTEGGPFTPGWRGAEHDELWLREARGTDRPR